MAAFGAAFLVAFLSVIIYSYTIETPKARASMYVKKDRYLYHTDHVGRPFWMRKYPTATNADLYWRESHYPFGVNMLESD